MTDNPALRARGQDVQIVFFSGAAATVKGAIGLAETSASEAGQPYGDFGPIAWLDFSGDGQQVEFVEYTDDAGQRVQRRTIKAEKVGTLFAVWKLHMTAEATVLPRAHFDAADFDPVDFNAA